MASTKFQEKAATRLSLCFDMFEFGADMMEQKLRRDHPSASDDEIRGRLSAWLHDRPGAEYGDGQGHPGTWPRSPR